MQENGNTRREPNEQDADGVFLLDQEGHFIALNSAAERISGYTAREAGHMTFRELCAPDQLENSVCALDAALAGHPCSLDTAIICKDGRRRHIHLSGGPITIHGAKTGVFLTAERSRRRETEELRSEREKLRAALSTAECREREKLAHILHDELQQLLVSIKFRMALIDNGIADMRSVTEEIAQLVEDAIRTSRNLATELNPPALREGLRPALEWLSGWARHRFGLFVNLNVPESLNAPENVTAFLFHAVRELLFNAAKHANVTHARVYVAREGHELQIAVEDDGAGFDPERCGESRSSPAGLGLASIKERISLLGGRMEISSAPGAGTRFRLIMPLTGTLP